MFEKRKDNYNKIDTKLPQYIPLPQCLLTMKLSQTAKILDGVLLSRATLSQKNNMTDDREHVKREYDELVTRNRSICFEEKKMYQWTFANDDGCNSVTDGGKRYVDNWLEMKKQNISYLFWAPVGTGKSYTSGCIANALIE